jgi:hypothetical protein
MVFSIFLRIRAGHHRDGLGSVAASPGVCPSSALGAFSPRNAGATTCGSPGGPWALSGFVPAIEWPFGGAKHKPRTQKANERANRRFLHGVEG